MNITAYDLAQRFIGLHEVSGVANNPSILAMLQLDNSWPSSDEVPWCSAFVNYIAWLLRLPRSKSLQARSWLLVGLPLIITHDVHRICPTAAPGWDVVVFKRGTDPASGHVGFWAGQEGTDVLVLGGNQLNSVQLKRYPAADVLGVRRLYGT